MLHVLGTQGRAMVLLWRIAEDWPVEFVTENISRLGYTAEDFISQRVSWPGITHPDDGPRLEAEIADNLARGVDEFAQSYRLVTRAGEIRWMENSTIVIRDDDGKPAYLQGVVLDVTDRKRTEETLRKRNALLVALNDYSLSLASIPTSEDIFSSVADKLKQATDAVVAAISIYDKAASDLVVRYMTLSGAENSKLARTLGHGIVGMHFKVTPEMYECIMSEVVGTMCTLSELSFGVIPDPLSRVIERLFGIGWFTSLALQYKGKLIGTAIIAGREGAPRFDREELRAFAGVTANALGRWMAERSLGESETRWQFALEGAGDGVWDWNTQTNYAFFSRQWKAMLGYEDHEIGTDPEEWRSRLHPDDKERCYADLERHYRGEMPVYQNEYRMLCKDGTYKWIFARGKVIEWADNGSPLRVIGVHTDVTEQKRVVEALQESNALLQGLFNHMTSNAAIYEVRNGGATGRDYVVKDFNRAALRLEGKGKDEVIGKSLFDLRPKVDQSGLISVFKQVWDTGEATYYPAGVGQDGEFSNWYENSVFKLPTGEIVTIYDDVTDQRRAEEALRENESKFRSITEQITDVIFMTDNEGRITYISPAASQIFGASPEEIIGSFFMDSLSESAIPLARSAFESDLRFGRRQEGIILQMKRKDGSLFTGELRANVFYVEDVVSGTLGVIRDVTERQRAETVLRESEEKLRAFVDSSADMIYLKDENFRHLIANPPLCAFFGLEESAVLGKTDFEVMPEDAARECRLSDSRALDLRTTAIQEERVGACFFETVKFPVPLGGERWGVGGIIRDITERKQAEAALQESHRRLEQALIELQRTQEQLVQQERLAAVGQLAAGIAHDFNNILAVIALYTELMARTPDLPSQFHERLNVIAEQCGRAAALVQQILDFSCQAVLKRYPLSLGLFLREVVELLQRTMPESIRIELSCDLQNDNTIHADPERIQQALVNLALNARDAMPEGGTLRIALSEVSGREGVTCVNCGPVTTGEWIQIAVADTGPGIPPDVLPHLFEPFFTTRAPLGHGLGLAQVYGIVKQHEGHIAVETHHGQGATFKLYFPALPEPHLEVEVAPSGLVVGNKQTLLIVEDDAVTRAALVDVLEELNYNVLEAAGTREALLLFEEHLGAVDLVLSDWGMPNLDGLKLAQALNAYDPPIKVVMLTRQPLSSVSKGVVSENVVGWLQKPFDLEHLSEVITRALGL
jgi:PAS domain S-box-containing protein